MDISNEFDDPDLYPSSLLDFDDPSAEQLMLSGYLEEQNTKSTIETDTYVIPTESKQATTPPSILNNELEVPCLENNSTTDHEQVHLEGSIPNNETTNLNIPVLQRISPDQINCATCVTLREMVHSNAARRMIFTVHGDLGRFEHAILDILYLGENGNTPQREFLYADLRKQSHELVKRFMIDCIKFMKSDIRGLVKNSIPSFIEILFPEININNQRTYGIKFKPPYFTFDDDQTNPILTDMPQNLEVGDVNASTMNQSKSLKSCLDGPINTDTSYTIFPYASNNMNINNCNSIVPSTSNNTNINNYDPCGGYSIVRTNIPSDNLMQNSPGGHQNSPKATVQKSKLATQRQRTANMGISELARYLHLPMVEAAKALDVCSTALKHVCRRNGLARWPSRKIKAIDRQIQKLRESGNRPGDLGAVNEEIETLQKNREKIYEGTLATISKTSNDLVRSSKMN